MPARGSTAVDTGVCPDRGLDALVAEELFDSFERAGLGVEEDLCAEVAELMRGEHDAAPFSPIGHDQKATVSVIFRLPSALTNTPCGPMTDNFRREPIAILDQHPGEAGGISNASSIRFLTSLAGTSSVEIARGPAWRNK